MNFLDIFFAILEVIVILGVLISLHEAGHLAMAKIFKVYCFEYSIGFGPKLIHVRRKGAETYFSLRAIPLGGYVSMYGESGEVPEGFEQPDDSRSLLVKPAYQKALIQVAGVTVNFILGLILIFISDSCFPQYYSAYQKTYEISETSSVASYFTTATYSGDVLSYIDANKEEGYEAKNYVVSLPTTVYNNQAIMLSDEVHISGSDDVFTAIYYPTTLLEDHELSKSVRFFIAGEESPTDGQKALGIARLPSTERIEKGEYYDFANSPDGTSVTMKLSFIGIPSDGNASFTEQYNDHRLTTNLALTVKGGALESSGVSFTVIKQWLGWGRAWQAWAKDVPTACGAIVQGFASLFTGGFQNLSGIVGITAALPQIAATGGAARIFYFAGLLSINLAFFNLLPFPGLDGWALIVTAYEAITRKRVSAKVQNIVSVIGFALLAALMIAVTIKDIIQLFI
ncbi:MAG: site-2 protease family protein [Bacilli bacterium]|nr:site-2 protease family protein [Bacilli bacterium]